MKRYPFVPEQDVIFKINDFGAPPRKAPGTNHRQVKVREERGALLRPGLYLLGLEIEGEAAALTRLLLVGVAY